MAKLIGGVPKTQHEAQDRANGQASHLLGWQARQIRDQKGADEANARRVQRQDEMGKRPSGNTSTNPLTSQQGLKQAKEVTDVFKERKGR